MKVKHVIRDIFICCFIFSFYSISSTALERPDDAASQPTITMDFNNPEQSINYQDVNQFTAHQDKSQAKHAKADASGFTLSDKPIIIAEKQTIYAPSKLYDLGYEIDAAKTVTRVSSYHFPEHISRLAVIPEFVVTKPAAPVSVANNSNPVNEIHLHHIKTTQQVNTIELISLIVAAVGLTLACAFMLILLSRSARTTLKSEIFSGTVTQNGMTGKGTIFNFNSQHFTKPPMHTTYMDMMWQLGRLSHNNAVDTYFYMAIFIPSYKNYASILRRKIAQKAMEKDTN